MMSIKPLIAAFGGVSVAVLLFLGMAAMVAPPDDFSLNREEPVLVDFSSRRQDSASETRSRKKPPPPPEAPVTPQSNTQDQTPAPVTAPALSLSPLSTDLSVGDLVSSSGLLDGVSVADAEVAPLVRPPAVYPARAKMRNIEGSVTARLTIRPDGTVSDVEIIQAEPQGVFEREAMRAMYRYRFSPKMVNGEAVTQTATQMLEFSLQ
ncbi:outer membrane transport energization protein TonB [Thalassolituus maritimus]|uniref:Protein TonB n=1 Tax=Thalassolituus maritimus TaxID=484498 RepID=A0A1N7LA10_9GAMM|nr:energy transducer TonB [Thalassolituus maritimus]SIS70668.1 outer membrane transport energization protein TonB [Thalassolituus maritimus]